MFIAESTDYDAEVALALDATAPDAGTLRERRRHLPHLDGLRTVAVYLVVAFHAGLAVFRGGFVGVDIFFVLSGFLVTGILMRDLASGGRIDWRRFYSRRVRRILPASLVALLITTLVYSAVATPLQRLDAVGGIRAAYLFVANWYFLRNATDYFAVNVNSSPVLHFWSLAVEEQFYLLWPLVLGGLYLLSGWFGARRWWFLRCAVTAGAIASAVEALHLGATNLERAYYGTDTRAYQLLAGAALALSPQLLRFASARRSRITFARTVAALALGGLLVLASSMFEIGAITRGLLVAATAVVLIVALENASGGIVTQFLSAEPMTYLGRISYGTYLWHWPVIIVLTHDRHRSPLGLFAVTCVVATALAALSFRLLEHPVRVSGRLDRYKTQIVAIGFATSIVMGVVVVPSILDTGNPTAAALAVLRFDKAATPSCLGRPVSQCELVHGHGRRVLLLGDSNARMWIPALTEIARRHSLTFSVAVQDACPWQLGLLYPNSHPQCRAERDDWYARFVPEYRPDVVIVVDRALDDPILDVRPISSEPYSNSATYEHAIGDLTTQSIQRLSAPGRQVVVFEPTPLAAISADPLSCLSTGVRPTRCGYRASPGPTPYERYLRTMSGPPASCRSISIASCARDYLAATQPSGASSSSATGST